MDSEGPAASVAVPAAGEGSHGSIVSVGDPGPPGSSQTWLVRGVAHADQARYAELQLAGRFECFDGSAKFSSFVAVVNDDFCDCQDGSDEPGTSACSNRAGLLDGPTVPGFTCGWELDAATLDEHAARRRIVYRSRVNDGICDCCAGEDEWDGSTTCQDVCASVEAEEQKHVSVVLAGSRAREDYVQRAKALQRKSRHRDVDGGPDNAFLAQGCVDLNDGEYRYEVCIFDHVTQHGSGRSFNLGRGGTWGSTLWENGQHRTEYKTLTMDGGDRCGPTKEKRKSEINFQCHPEVSIESVQELRTCVYSIEMRTPAACPPLSSHSSP